MASDICQALLQELSTSCPDAHVTLIEAGRELGGRVCTKTALRGLQWDHGTQYFSVKQSEPSYFAGALRGAMEAGVAMPWGGAGAQGLTLPRRPLFCHSCGRCGSCGGCGECVHCTGTPVHYEEPVRERGESVPCTGTLVHYAAPVREGVGRLWSVTAAGAVVAVVERGECLLCTGTLVHYEEPVRERLAQTLAWGNEGTVGTADTTAAAGVLDAASFQPFPGKDLRQSLLTFQLNFTNPLDFQSLNCQ